MLKRKAAAKKQAEEENFAAKKLAEEEASAKQARRGSSATAAKKQAEEEELLRNKQKRKFATAKKLVEEEEKSKVNIEDNIIDIEESDNSKKLKIILSYGLFNPSLENKPIWVLGMSEWISSIFASKILSETDIIELLEFYKENREKNIQ